MDRLTNEQLENLPNSSTYHTQLLAEIALRLGELTDAVKSVPTETNIVGLRDL